MSLIDCPDCGYERSDQNESVCPKCGHMIGQEEKAQKKSAKLQEEKERLKKEGWKYFWWCIVGLLIWFVFGKIALNFYSDGREDWFIPFGACVANGFGVCYSYQKFYKAVEDLRKMGHTKGLLG